MKSVASLTLMWLMGCGGAEAKYSERGAQARLEWLMENGCSPSMVNPKPYAAAEPPDAPMPKRSAAPPAVPQSGAVDEEVAK